MLNRITGQLLRMCEPGRSYVTQGDRKIRNLPPLPPATVILHFPDSTSPGPASSPIGRSGPQTANQNGRDLYPYDDETGQSGDM